jgi:transposase
LLYEYRLGHSARVAAKNISNAKGETPVSHATASNWFNRFKENNFELKDEPRSGRPIEVDLDHLKVFIQEEPKQTTRCLANTLGCSQSTIHSNLKEFGLIEKLGVWVPQVLSHLHKKQRLGIHSNLSSSRRTFNWLDHLVTGDEKLVLYVNYTRRHQWLYHNQHSVPSPKSKLHLKKVMFSVWWDVKG